MKNNLLIALLSISIYASPTQICAAEQLYALWDTITGIRTTLSTLMKSYYNYKQNVTNISDLFEDFSWLYNYKRYKKNASLDKQFSKAAQELYDRYLTPIPYKSSASIKSSINLLKTIVTGLPEETFNIYKTVLGSKIAQADTRTKIDYYINQIIEKLKKKKPNDFTDSSIPAFKHEFLRIIYHELLLSTQNISLITVIKPMLEELKEKSGQSALNESQRENLLRISFNKIPSDNFVKIFPKKEIPDSFLKMLVEVTEGLNSADIESFISNASQIAMNKNSELENIDCDCFARALWDIKQIKYRKQLPQLPEKEKIIDPILPKEQKKLRKYFLDNTNNMTLTDIQEIIEKATKYAAEKPKKTLEERLTTVVEAQNKLLKIKQMRDLIHLCEKIYNPTKIEKWNFTEKISEELTRDQRTLLSTLEPEIIFKKFEKRYVTDNYLNQYENLSKN